MPSLAKALPPPQTARSRNPSYTVDHHQRHQHQRHQHHHRHLHRRQQQLLSSLSHAATSLQTERQVTSLRRTSASSKCSSERKAGSSCGRHSGFVLGFLFTTWSSLGLIQIFLVGTSVEKAWEFAEFNCPKILTLTIFA